MVNIKSTHISIYDVGAYQGVFKQAMPQGVCVCGGGGSGYWRPKF